MSWLADAEVKTADVLDAERKAELCRQIEQQRKAAEAEGVVINGVRYSGSPSNRQALLEVVQFAREAGVETFASWKDSDDEFRANHPLADVEQALVAIAARRGQLIALEGQHQTAVKAGEIDNVGGLSWDV